MSAAAPERADLTVAAEALGRWLDALHGFGEEAPVRAAVVADVRVERHGWDQSRGTVMEVFTGPEALAAWCGRTPRTVRFTVAAPRPPTSLSDTQPPVYEARYTISVGDYVNHGTWRLQLADDGRIAWLEHLPDDLPEDWRDGVPEGMSLGTPAPPHGVSGGSHAHAHEHEHDPSTSGATGD